MAKKEAHHGGAWKVAYADFVTAMMALFMVLWISAQDPKIVIATSQYFKNPFLAAAADATSGVLPFNNRRSSPSTGSEKGEGKDKDNQQAVKLTMLNSVAADFFRLLHLQEDLAEKPINIEVTADGLRVTIFNRSKKPVFVGDTAKLTEWGNFVMQNLAWVIDHHRFRVIIDGHTRSHLPLKGEKYTTWDLSADRALEARRALVHYAVDAGQIDRVSGYGDTRPIPGIPPDAEANERISLSLSLAADKVPENKLDRLPGTEPAHQPAS
ncbi:MAG TPA: flagellar motor protein MotB [Opitutaceae bacterium]|nr:flagellar motor protein MotB [Opitutaceae bacterium]